MRVREFQRSPVDWVVIFTVGALLLIGLAYLYSAIIARTDTQALVEHLQNQSSGVLNREFAFQLFLGIGGGSLLAYLLFRTDYHTLFRYAPAVMYGVIFLLAVIFIPVSIATIAARIQGASVTDALISLSDSTQGILHYANNSIRWIKIGVSIQPSEIAKLALLVFIASVIDKYKEINLIKFARPLIVIGLTFLMILIQPDLGTVVVLSVVLLAGLWVAGVKVRYFAGLLALVAVVGALFVVTASYRNTRVVTWVYQNFCRDISIVNPPPKSEQPPMCRLFEFNKYNVDAFQTEQIRSAMARGGITGVGYNNGNLKTIIPEVRTDGIIGVIGEESGFIMIAIVLILYGILFYRGIDIASKAPDTAGKVLATGITVWIAFQAIWNITGMTGLIPMKGLTLPFISEGNSSMIITLAAVGILLNISTQQDVANRGKVYKTSPRFIHR